MCTEYPKKIAIETCKPVNKDRSELRCATCERGLVQQEVHTSILRASLQACPSTITSVQFCRLKKGLSYRSNPKGRATCTFHIHVQKPDMYKK